MSILYYNHHEFPESILIRDFKNVVTINEIIDSWEYLFEKNLITPKTRGIINNLTECELKMDLKSRTILFDYLNNKEDLKRLKLAVICTSSKTIVFPTLAETEVDKVRIKPFSTVQAAVSWIIS